MAEKKKKPSEGMSETLAALLPSIAGTLFGGEAAVAGAQASGKLLGDIVSASREEEKYLQRKQIEGLQKQEEIAARREAEMNKPLTPYQQLQAGFEQKRIALAEKSSKSRAAEQELLKQGEERRFLSTYRGALKEFTQMNKNEIQNLKRSTAFSNALKDPNFDIKSDAINVYISKAVLGEVGNLSATDLKAAGVPLNVIERGRAAVKEWYDGATTEEKKAAAVKMIETINTQSRNFLQTEAQARGKYIDLDFAKKEGSSAKRLFEESLLQYQGQPAPSKKIVSPEKQKRVQSILERIKKAKGK